MDLEPREYTPAMEAVIQMRAQRMAAGICTPITPEPSDDETETEIGTVVKVHLSWRERGQWAVYYNSLQSIMITFSYSLAYQLWGFFL